MSFMPDKRLAEIKDGLAFGLIEIGEDPGDYGLEASALTRRF